jgi:hypothetical protein
VWFFLNLLLFLLGELLLCCLLTNLTPSLLIHFHCFEDFGRLPWRSSFLVSPYFQRCMAFLNCRSWMAHLRLHSRRTKSRGWSN